MARKIRYEVVKLEDIKPYENNPRLNDDAVKGVMESIKTFGAMEPMVLDKDYVIICGHTRYKAAQKLKLGEFPCVIAEDLTDEEARGYRLADNKVAEAAEWDEDKLQDELAQILDIDMSVFGFGLDVDAIAGEEPDETYTVKVDVPQYEPTMENPPALAECYDGSKTKDLIAEIEKAEVSDAEKDFLKWAAYRHAAFNYRNIAEYYAHATPEMQRLMEKSALVIIDLEDAIANGYATLSQEITDMIEDGE